MSFHNLRNIAFAIALLYWCKTQRRSLHRTSQVANAIAEVANAIAEVANAIADVANAFAEVANALEVV